MSSPRESDSIVRNEPLPTVIVPAVQIFLVRKTSSGLEYFLGLRTDIGAFPHQWSVPGGATDDKLEEMDAVLEELEQETGIANLTKKPSLFRTTMASTVREKDGARKAYDYRINAYVLNAQTLEPYNASPTEHSEMRWWTFAEVIAHNTAVIKKARMAKPNLSRWEIGHLPEIVSLRAVETMIMIDELLSKRSESSELAEELINDFYSAA